LRPKNTKQYRHQKVYLVRYIIAEILSGLGSTALVPYAEDFGSYLGNKPDAEKTVERLLSETLNISRAAELGIHRNTLIFRLEKLNEKTGLNPVHCFEDALLCKSF
jgi:DNA-binding PucR family transcriptional regulator